MGITSKELTVEEYFEMKNNISILSKMSYEECKTYKTIKDSGNMDSMFEWAYALAARDAAREQLDKMINKNL